MDIAYLSDSNKYIQVTSPELNDFIANIADYTAISIVGIKNCGSIEYNQEYTADSNIVFDDSNLFYFAENLGNPQKLYVTPALFGITNFIDGIYKIQITLTKIDNTGFIVFSNCLFVDVTFKCRVASLIKDILRENENLQDSEKISTLAHILHYALTNGSGCGCNCEELCEVFNALSGILITINPTTDCGC